MRSEWLFGLILGGSSLCGSSQYKKRNGEQINHKKTVRSEVPYSRSEVCDSPDAVSTNEDDVACHKIGRHNNFKKIIGLVP